jgi:hypothetical protein
MVGDPKRDPLAGLAALMAGQALGAGSFNIQSKNYSDEVRRKLDSRWMREIIHLTERFADRMPPDQRYDFMLSTILRAVSEAPNEGEEAKVTNSADWEGFTAWLAQRLINDNSVHVSEISAVEPDAIAVKQDVSAQRTVSLDSVIRGGSYFTAAISIMSLVATGLSHVIIIQPFVALFFLIASIGFFCMTLVPHDTDR